jgi:hypothetical protein
MTLPAHATHRLRHAAPHRPTPARAAPGAVHVAALATTLAFFGGPVLAHATEAAAAQAQAQAQAQMQAQMQSLEQLRATTVQLVEALAAQGLISRERADAMLRQAQTPPAPASAQTTGPAWGTPLAATVPGGKPVQRVPYLSETVRDQLREAIKLDVLEQARAEGWADSRQIPAWSRRITLSGDVRVRLQSDLFDADNLLAEDYRAQVDGPAWAPDLLNTTTDRHRLTLRGRLALDAKLSDDTSAGLRLTTGTASGPTSSSVTLGSNFNKLNVALDRAFVRWDPRFDLRFFGGRMANPFHGSDLLWPDDLSLDGIAAQGELTLGSGIFAFATAGAFPLEEFNVSSSDKWLYGLQAGVDWALDNTWQLRMSLGVYDFHGIEGVRETALPPAGPRAGTVGYLASQYPASARLKGNTLMRLNCEACATDAPVWGLASKFRPVNLTAGITFNRFDPVLVGVTLDWVKNSAFDLGDIARRAGATQALAFDGLREKTTGVQGRVLVGPARLAERGDWQAFAALRRFERDAWPDAFTDTTWHGGGTNYQGWTLGGQYAFDRNASVGLRLTSTRNLDDRVRFLATPGDPNSVSGNLSSAPLKIETLQIDVSTRF